MNSRTSWLDGFFAIDEAPWPGPRPIRESGPLKGREEDADVFLAAVLDHLLVVLTADSGVGKTSLLHGSLIPTLRAEGFSPIVIDQWHFDHDEDPGEFVGRAVAEGLRDDQLPAPDSDVFWQEVDDAYGDELVLILDQFEELVRFQAGLFRRTRSWIGELNRHHQIRVVISLRAEYHHQLRELERTARPFTMTTHRLEPIADETNVRAVIDGFDPAVGSIASPVREAIIKEWLRARTEDNPPGLLHLQGLLYALHHGSTGSPRQVTEEEFKALRDRADQTGTPMFELGLRSAVEFKLKHCREASERLGFDRVLIDGTDALVHRMVPHLSSGGFKLVLDEWTVARRALAAEMARSGLGDDQLKEIYGAVRAVCLDSSTRELRLETWPVGSPTPVSRHILGPVTAVLAGHEPSSSTYEHADWVPWIHDPRDVSSGPMLGMAPQDVMFQELRRFAFAMLWLEAASLIRRSVPEPGRTMIALIHDGFGDALERGYAAQAETFAHTMARLTGARGEELHWSSSTIEEHCARSREEVPALGAVPLINVRWRDCAIRDVEFENLVFVNGDFRGSRFEGCRFRGVTFVNCLLDNASFTKCELVGGSEENLETLDFERLQKDDGRKIPNYAWDLVKGGDRQLPDFRVDVPPSEAALLEQYRRVSPSGVSTIYSRTSGIAAHPLPPDAPSGIGWRPAAGGLAVFGGRLSSLLLCGCRFSRPDPTATLGDAARGAGKLVLGHIAGASLDLVEHSGGRVEILDSIIRGLTVTSPDIVTAEDLAADSAGEVVTNIEVLTTVMANTWFDAGVRGRARFRDCILAQLVSCSSGLEIEADPIDHDDIPVGFIGSAQALEAAFQSALPWGPVAPLDAFAAMDYRSQPARAELGGSSEAGG